MSVPGVARGRRAFFAPVWLVILAAIAVASLGLLARQLQSTATFIVVRHAERDPGMDPDPPLNAAGRARADRLASLLGEQGLGRPIGAIFVSDTRRARDTAEPLARSLRLTPTALKGSDVSQLLKRARAQAAVGPVLIVGHSNTIPQIVRGLVDFPVFTIAENEFDAVFVIVRPRFGPPSVVTLRY